MIVYSNEQRRKRLVSPNQILDLRDISLKNVIIVRDLTVEQRKRKERDDATK